MNKIDVTEFKDEILRIGNFRHDLARKNEWNPLNQMTDVKTPDRDIFGARGEFTCCKALGIDPRKTALYVDIDKPDKGWDAIHKGYKFEFKDTQYPNGHMIYQPKTMKFGQDIWVLSVPFRKSEVDDICLEMKIGGWIWRKDMHTVWEEFFYDPSAWAIKQSQLSDFEDLFKLKAKDTPEDSLWNYVG